MSSEKIERYYFIGGQGLPHPSGHWVRYEDVEKLIAERDALKAKAEHVEHAGTMLSNIAFNLSQHEGRVLSAQDCRSLKDVQLAFDAARKGGSSHG